MKKKCLVAATLILLSQTTLLALDTLHLHIPVLNSARIRLQLNANTPMGNQARMEMTSANWVLKISNAARAKITLSNTEPGSDPVTFEDMVAVFEVKNNVLTARNFKFNKHFQFSIAGADNALIKKYTIEMSDAPGQGTTGVNTPQNTADGRSAIEEYVPGSMVYDAIALADNNTNINIKAEILDYYAAGRPIDSVFATNKFLKDLVLEIKTLRGAQSGGGLTSVLASVGGLDVTKYADGIAKFLVKRVKQELSVAFFERFKAIIDSTKDIKTLFPKTAILLDAIDIEVYDYERYIQNLREAFKADIVMIHRNLPGIVKNHPDFFNRHLELKAALLSGCYIAEELENQAHPGDILANYPIEYLEGLSLDFSGAVQTLQVVSASFRDTTTGDEANYWVPIKALRQLVNHQLSLKYFLGLVYHEALTKYGSVPFKSTNLVEMLDKVADRYDQGVVVYNAYKRYFLRFAEKTDALNKMIQEYDDMPVDSAALEKYGAYLRSAVDMIQYCTQASNLPLINEHVPDLDSLFNKYFLISYAASDLLTNISKKNYSAAINDVVRIYNLVRVKPLQDNLTDENKKAASSVVVTQNRLAKYGSFMASVATAKTPDEVAKAIEVAALPVGSSRVKRETLFNVSVNAYVGPYIGYERIKGVDSGKINSYGITAPIGIAISKGYSILFFNSKTRSSSSIFISLIDLGAVTAFRFTNDSTEKLPTIELKDIVSPGIFFSHGFGKTPLSLNVGYQIGPLLRRVNLDENEFGKTYSRISVSLCVDIPVFNLFSRSK